MIPLFFSIRHSGPAAIGREENLCEEHDVRDGKNASRNAPAESRAGQENHETDHHRTQYETRFRRLITV